MTFGLAKAQGTQLTWNQLENSFEFPMILKGSKRTPFLMNTQVNFIWAPQWWSALHQQGSQCIGLPCACWNCNEDSNLWGTNLLSIRKWGHGFGRDWQHKNQNTDRGLQQQQGKYTAINHSMQGEPVVNQTREAYECLHIAWNGGKIFKDIN